MKRAFLVLVILALAVWAFRHSGSWLVVNDPEKSDALVVLAGDSNDVRYWRGMELLRQGYGRHMFLDASQDLTKYGETWAERAHEFVDKTAGDMKGRVTVCPIWGDSTKIETKWIGKCLETVQPKSVIVVTSSDHTRRALSVMQSRLPQYHWTAAAANDPYFYGERWWQSREWAKTWLQETVRYAWWNVVDRWRK